MSAVHWKTLSARVLGPAVLCLGLAAIPAAAWACDMQAVDEELAREAKAAPAVPQVQAAADPSPNTATDPSPNDESSKAPTQTAAPTANGSGSSTSAQSGSQAGAKPAAPMGHTEGTEQEKKQ